MKKSTVLLALLALAVIVSPGAAQEETAKKTYGAVESAEIVRIKDVKGVVTIATGFGKLFGPDALNAIRGESTVQIPFERIQRLETGKIVDHRMPVLLKLMNGQSMEVIVDGHEYQGKYAGTADFGYFRLRFQDIREITWTRVKRRAAALGQKCSKGHIFYNDTWHYCPYDGEKLKPIAAAE
ncbi:MAG: hypothetical protein ABFS86_15830 [Planctomycetota bacterium]